MMTKFKKETKQIQQRLKHCPDCAYYVDGKKELHEMSGSVRFFPEAGLQFRRISNGDIYQQLGTVTPCTCSSGLVRARALFGSSVGSTMTLNQFFGNNAAKTKP